MQIAFWLHFILRYALSLDHEYVNNKKTKTNPMSKKAVPFLLEMLLNGWVLWPMGWEMTGKVQVCLQK